MNKDKKFWLKLVGIVAGCFLVVFLIRSVSKEDRLIVADNVSEKMVLDLDKLASAKTKPEIVWDIEPNCEDEECAKELALEEPIFSEVPDYLQAGCNLYFDHDSYSLDENYLGLLKKHIDFLKTKGKEYNIVIESYVDPQECIGLSEETPFLIQEQQRILSDERAQYIQHLLEKSGVASDRIEILSYGAKGFREDSNIAQQSSESNRRILLTYRTHQK